MRVITVSVCAVFLACAGCPADDETSGAGANGGSSGGSGSGGTAGAGAAPGSECETMPMGDETSCDDPLVLISGDCVSPEPDPGCTEGTNVNAVLGVVTDGSGIPVPNSPVRIQVLAVTAGWCATSLTDAGGYQFAIPARFNCVSRLIMQFGLPTISASALGYCEADLDSLDSAILAMPPGQTFEVDPPLTLPPLGDGSLPRIVVFQDGLEVDVVPDQIGGEGNYNALASKRVPVDGLLPCIAEGKSFEGLYAFAPEVRVDGSGFQIRIPNSTGLPIGSRVDFEVIVPFLEGDPDRPLWTAFGTGTVLPNGETIESDLSSELPYFSWLGYVPQ
jgi:hypothetical protein